MGTDDGGLGEQARGSRVGRSAFLGQDVLVDGGAHDRVHEGGAAVAAEHVGRGQRVGRLRRRVGPDAGQRRRAVEVRVLTENRHRPRERHAVRAHAGQPREHRARDRRRPEREHLAGAGARRREVVGGQRGEQLDDEERVATARRRARRDELVVRRGAHPVADERADRRFAQRLRAQHAALRVGQHGVDQVAGRRGSHGQHHQRRRPSEAGSEVGEEPQRRRVRPLGIVDREQQRATPCEVRRQPVQAVEDAEERVRAGRERRARERRREGRRPREQLGSLRLARPRQRRLEQLADDPEREVVLELGRAGREDGEPAVGRRAPGLCEQARLADAGRPDHREQRAVTGRRALEERGRQCQFGIALQQPCGASVLHRRQHYSGSQWPCT